MDKTVLIVSPHPDDLEIGMGGTVAKMIDENIQVVSLIATDGSGSTTLKDLSRDELADVRISEAKKASDTLSVQVFIPLPLSDVKSERNKEHFKNDFKETVLRYTPDEIYIPHPDIDKHPTHQIVSTLVLDELKEISEHEPKIWCYEVWTPFPHYDRIEDISKYIDLKISAIEAHQSQLEYKNYTEGILGLNKYRAIFDERHGHTKMEFAEVFIELPI